MAFKNTPSCILVLNLTPTASVKTEFWSHTHTTYVLTLKYRHTALLHARYQVRSQHCHFIVAGQAFGRLPSEGFICYKTLQKQNKTKNKTE